MLPCSYVVLAERTSPKWGYAFTEGCGGRLSSQETLRPGPVAMFGSPARWGILQQAIGERRDWYYGDHAYFGRHHFYRITKNAYQHTGVGPPDYQRFRAFGRPVQPWRTYGHQILLCLQSPTFMGLHGLNFAVWKNSVISELRRYTDRQIVCRDKLDPQPIARHLPGTWAVVTYASAAALDALIAGIPVFVLADFAAAYSMGTPDLSRIESPVYPEGRERFMAVLAANQWTLEEMRRGDAWRALEPSV